jgi:hypothetical protein
MRLQATLVGAALVLGACSNSLPPPVAPRISGLGAVQFPQDTSKDVTFSITDADTPVGTLQVTLESSNPAVLPLSGVRLAGAGETRTLTLVPTPEATGTANVTVRVSDATGLVTTATLAVTVQAVVRSFRGLVNDTFARSGSGDPISLQGFSLQADADGDPAAFDALLR